MTRLAAEAKMQYVPVPPTVTTLMATLVGQAPRGARILDVCAGEGTAVTTLAETWGIDKEHRLLNELADERRNVCATKSTVTVLGADAIRGLQISKHAAQVAWTNPPFGYQPKEQGGGRLEPLFFRRVVEQGAWLQPLGVHLMLAPQDVWAGSLSLVNHVARCYDDVSIFVLPDDLRTYRECLVVGVVRHSWRTGDELRVHASNILHQFLGTPPVLTAHDTPRYAIPMPITAKVTVWRDAQAASPEQAMGDVVTMGGAWSSREHRLAMVTAREERRRIRPLFPLGKVAAALRIADGDINNLPVVLGGKEVRIKGSTRKTVRRWDEEKITEKGTTVTTHEVDVREPVVVTVTQREAIPEVVSYIGDKGMASLMDIPGAADALLTAVAVSAPPIYAMEIAPHVRAIIDGIVSVTGRALPGYEPGFVPMQKHLIAAAYQAFLEPDPQTGKARQSLGIAAKMGCGKSGIGIGAVEVLRQLLPTNKNRAFTVLLVAPNHLAGERSSVANGAPSPHWVHEWEDLLPDWHIEILETPAQVAAFYAAAKANTEKPRVGIVAFSKFSLSSGWSPAAMEHKEFPVISSTNAERVARVSAMVAAMNAYEEHETTVMVESRKKAKDRAAQRVDNANGDVAVVETAMGPGVSERTKRRDALYRCGVAYRNATPLWHWDGVYCPDCGRRLRTKDGAAHTPGSLKRAGMTKCFYCGNVVGQIDRKQDNVSDRALPVFTDSHADYVDGNGRKVIPWGEKPKSNPRMALGSFIIARGFAEDTDILLTDEVHGMKGGTSARGQIWGQVSGAVKRSIGLTGSPYGGKASTAYWLLQRMGNPLVRGVFGWDEEKEFVGRYGILDRITTKETEEDAQVLRGKAQAPKVRVEERTGLTAELATMMQSQFLFILLEQMGFHLPTYSETVQFLDMPVDIAQEYKLIEMNGKAIVGEPGGHDALGSYLQSSLSYPMIPWKPVTVFSKNNSESHKPKAVEATRILPHHTWLTERAMASVAESRGMLVFCEHTNKLDILSDLRDKMIQIAEGHGVTLKIAVLRSTTVKPGDRGAWFAAREADGTNVVLCHPGLVETGMNLIKWPEIVFAEPTYSIYRAMQARKRAMRPTQTKHCNVTWLGYKDTMIAQALDIISGKATAAALLDGDDLSSGLMQIDPGMSLLQELARRVQNDASAASHDAITARFVSAGKAVHHAVAAAAKDFVGVDMTHVHVPEAPRRRTPPPPREYTAVVIKDKRTQAEAVQFSFL